MPGIFRYGAPLLCVPSFQRGRGLPALPAPSTLRGVVEAVVSAQRILDWGAHPARVLATPKTFASHELSGNGINEECCGDGVATKSPRRLLPGTWAIELIAPTFCSLLTALCGR